MHFLEPVEDGGLVVEHRTEDLGVEAVARGGIVKQQQGQTCPIGALAPRPRLALLDAGDGQGGGAGGGQVIEQARLGPQGGGASEASAMTSGVTQARLSVWVLRGRQRGCEGAGAEDGGLELGGGGQDGGVLCPRKPDDHAQGDSGDRRLREGGCQVTVNADLIVGNFHHEGRVTALDSVT